MLCQQNIKEDEKTMGLFFTKKYIYIENYDDDHQQDNHTYCEIE